MRARIDRPDEGLAPVPWRERDDLRASVHGPLLAAFEQAIAHIGHLSVLVQESSLAVADKDRALDYLAVAAARTLQANIIYVEQSVFSDPARV